MDIDHMDLHMVQLEKINKLLSRVVEGLAL